MEQILTFLDAEVEEKNWDILKNTYKRETSVMPDEIYETFLIQSKSSRTSWRIITLWRSLEDLEKMRQSTSVPLAVMIFNKAGAKPILGVWNVVSENFNNDSQFFKSQ